MQYLFPVISLAVCPSLAAATTEISNPHPTVPLNDDRLSGQSARVARRGAAGAGESMMITLADGASGPPETRQGPAIAMVFKTQPLSNRADGFFHLPQGTPVRGLQATR